MARARDHNSLPNREQHAWAAARHAVTHTVPGRALLAGLIVRLLVAAAATVADPLPAFLSVLDAAGGLAIAFGAAYFAYRLLVIAKHRLLWRVRRKLILSYIFIGFVPSLLIVSFFLLAGFLLFYNFSSFLLQSRLRALGDEARLVARTTALEIQRAGGDAAPILNSRRIGLERQYPGASLAVVPASPSCAPGATGAGAEVARGPIVEGPWAHVEPPDAVPDWIDCSGFGGVLVYKDAAEYADTHMLIRGVAFPDSARPRYGVVVDLPVDDAVQRRLRSDTGVELRQVSVVQGADGSAPMVLRGRGSAERGEPGSAEHAAPAGAPLKSVSLLDYRDWATGATGTLGASVQLSARDIFDQISGLTGPAGVRSVGQRLLVVLLEVVGGLFLVIEIVALAVGFVLARSITGSVHELFVGTERVRQGDFTHKIGVRADDQLGALARSFNSMTASIEGLLLQADEKKRLEQELRIARDIQMSLLPQGALRMPGLSVTALCVPAREVGGDYYDFFPIDERRLGVLIADVSGKGTSAALYMAELKGLMLSLSRIHTSPRELLIVANRIIAANLDARSFITMTYAVIDLEALTMTYARAGHTPLMYLPGPGAGRPRHIRILAPDGLVLGLKLDGGETFERLLEESTIPLGPGDFFLFFTDGLSEAMNEGDDCFGEARLGVFIEEHADLPSGEVRERMLREVETFVGAAPQHDDMTMILLKIDEADAPAVPAASPEYAELARSS